MADLKRKAAKYRVIAMTSLAVGVISLIMVFITLHIYNGSQNVLKSYKDKLKQIESSTEKPASTPSNKKNSKTNSTEKPKVTEKPDNNIGETETIKSSYDSEYIKTEKN